MVHGFEKPICFEKEFAQVDVAWAAEKQRLKKRIERSVPFDTLSAEQTTLFFQGGLRTLTPLNSTCSCCY